MIRKRSLIFVVAVAGFMFSCTSKDQLQKTIAENPEIVFEAIKKNPKGFFDAIEVARKEYEVVAREERARQEKEAFESEFKNPKEPKVEEGRVVFGDKDAPVTIVEYSDFQCPFCSKGANTMERILKEYKGKVRVVFKHLAFKPYARPAAKYYEAIAKQDHKKAKEFHTYVFENQRDLSSGGEDFLKKAAKKVGANMSKLKKELDDAGIESLIDADMAEARKFGFDGTPGYLVNGVSVRGAYPFDHFQMIIDRHLESETKKN